MKHHALLAALFVASCAFTTQNATAQQCSLDEISNALNNLQCEVRGGFVSVESLVRGVTGLCETFPTEESCSECFRRSRDKVKLSVKTLVKLKLLNPSALVELKPALRDAEDTTCAALGAGEDEEYPGEYTDPAPRDDRGRGRRGRGRGGDAAPGDGEDTSSRSPAREDRPARAQPER